MSEMVEGNWRLEVPRLTAAETELHDYRQLVTKFCGDYPTPQQRVDKLHGQLLLARDHEPDLLELAEIIRGFIGAMAEAGVCQDADNKIEAFKQCLAERAELLGAVDRERQLIALYLHSFAGSQVDPVEVADAVLTGAHMVAT